MSLLYLSCYGIFIRPTSGWSSTITARRFSCVLPSKMWRDPAGVAPSTVTQAIQTNPRLVMKQKRVREAVVELDYHPTLMLAALSANLVKSLLVPLIDSDVFYQNPFFPNCFKRITQIASDNDYAIQICTANEERRLDNLKQLIYWNRRYLIFLIPTRMIPCYLRSKTSSLPHSLRKAASPFCIASG